MNWLRTLLWSAGTVACLTSPVVGQVNNGYVFTDFKSTQDPTFTQLLGLNDRNQIAGYFGCGTPANVHPNKGFLLTFGANFSGTPTFTNVNFPNSQQDQNFSITNNGQMAGFWVDNNGVNHGYVVVNNTFINMDAPNTNFNQILGMDDNLDIVGVNGANGQAQNAESEFNVGGLTPNPQFLANLPLNTLGITPPIGVTMATGASQGIPGTNANPGFINLISGLNMPTGTTSNSFVIHTLSPGGRRGTTPVATNIVPPGGSTFIQALGVSKGGLVVGTYTDLNGIIHGFTFSLVTGVFKTVDNPNAPQLPGFGTTINGVNAANQIVGFYTNGRQTNAGCNDTIGFFAVPQTNPPPAPLFAALLPGSRTVPVGTPATVFASIINSGTTPLNGCEPSIPSTAPTSLRMTYAPTSPTTNQINGPANTPLTIAAGATQTFVLSFTSTAALGMSAMPITFSCNGVQAAPVFPRLTTLDLRFTPASSPEPDMIALAATDPSTPGICEADYTNNQPGAFAVATFNNGATDQVTVTPVVGGVGLPLNSLTVCQTNPSNGQCLAPPAASVTVTIAARATPTFAIFMTANNAIPFAPGAARVGLNFTDPTTGQLLGSTNVAMRTR